MINGLIDSAVHQGAIGDCWLLAAILALNSTANGRQILLNSVKSDSNNITVSFNGLKYENGQIVSFTISKEEIEKNTSDVSFFSKGNTNIVVWETAVDKLENDLKTQKICLPENPATYKNAPGDLSLYGHNFHINGSFPERLFFFLTGVVPHKIISIIDPDAANFSGLPYEIIVDFFEQFSKDYAAMTFSLYPAVNRLIQKNNKNFDIHRRIDLNRQLFSIELPWDEKKPKTFLGHSFSITNINTKEETVSFVDPVDSSIEYKFSWKQFANMYIFSMVVI